MLKAIRRFFSMCPNACCNSEPRPFTTMSNEVDFGHGFTGRQLINGYWVLEVGGKACDVRCLGHTWEAGSKYYTDCMVEDFEKLVAVSKHVMAAQGI